MSTGESINIALTVAFVNQGGNANDGKYFYNYTPDFALVSIANTQITYTLDDEHSKRFVILSYAICDPNNEMSDIQLTDTTLSMNDACNKQNELISLTIIVKDTVTGDLINCDPQVTNVPPPEEDV